MIGIQTWFELSINYFEDFWVEWKKGVSYFFQGFKYESISTPKITDKVGASGGIIFSMTTCAVSFNIGVQNYNKGFIREKAFKIFFRTSNGQILNEAQEDHECSSLYIYK